MPERGACWPLNREIWGECFPAMAFAIGCDTARELLLARHFKGRSNWSGPFAAWQNTEICGFAELAHNLCCLVPR